MININDFCLAHVSTYIHPRYIVTIENGQKTPIHEILYKNGEKIHFCSEYLLIANLFCPFSDLVSTISEKNSTNHIACNLCGTP